MKHLLACLAAVALVATVLPAAAATAHSGDDAEREGRCAHGIEWRIRAKPDDGRIEIEAEIDTDRRGQRWAWVLKHNGSVSDRGTSTTQGGGTFEVERRSIDFSGVDTFKLRATRKGVTCVAQVAL